MNTQRYLFLLLLIPSLQTACATKAEKSFSYLSVPVESKPIFKETFDTLDHSVWQLQKFGFEGNAANMLPENVAVEDSILNLNLTVNQKKSLEKPYNGSGMGTQAFFLYGYFEVRMKPSIGSGTVASFFLMNKWQPTNWEHREIDIEFLGNNTSAMQMTTHDFRKGGTEHKYAATTLAIGIDYTHDFHTYGILWTPEKVEWYVDRKAIYTETRYVPKEPLQIRVNHWPGDMRDPDMKSWLGPLDENRLPSKVEYDWIRVYPLAQL